MINIYLLTHLLTVAISISQYARITDYRQYVQKWAEIVPAHLIHDVSHMALPTQSCYANTKCQFFFYEYIENSTDPLKNRTILFVSGMHGNEYLGPHTLLYAYKHLKAARIIYFPMANPSGFIRNQRQTFPSQFDPNRDYPIDGNFECYRTSATHIIDSLFRKYSFDLTVVLHNGGSQIGFNWGTNTHRYNSHTQDYEIYYKIGKMMKSWGGKSNALGLSQFALGTMTEVIYPASGTFDDWAYAVGKFPSIITSCNNFNYKPYPQNMANGLLFLIQMGPFDAPQFGSEEGINNNPLSDQKDNGYVSRGIRMLKNLLEIIQPTVTLIRSQKKIGLQIRGCSSIKLYNLTLKLQQNSTSQPKIIKVKQNIQLQGDVSSQKFIFQYFVWLNDIAISQDQTISLESGNLLCDPEWEGKGTTFFSSKRIYQFNSTVNAVYANQTFMNSKHSQQQLSFIETLSILIEDNSGFIICLAIIGIFITILLIYIIKNFCQIKRIWQFAARKQLNFHIQLKEKQMVTDIQSHSNRDILQN